MGADKVILHKVAEGKLIELEQNRGMDSDLFGSPLVLCKFHQLLRRLETWEIPRQFCVPLWFPHGISRNWRWARRSAKEERWKCIRLDQLSPSLPASSEVSQHEWGSGGMPTKQQRRHSLSQLTPQNAQSSNVKEAPKIRKRV